MPDNIKEFSAQLTDKTLFGEWFSPMERALQKVRYSGARYSSLPMKLFIILEKSVGPAETPI